MNDFVTVRFLFRVALLLHALTFFIFDSFLGPAIAFSLAVLVQFPGIIRCFIAKTAFIFPLVGKIISILVLTPCYFLLITPLGVLQKKKPKENRSSTLVDYKREITTKFFHRQW